MLFMTWCVERQKVIGYDLEKKKRFALKDSGRTFHNSALMQLRVITIEINLFACWFVY